MRNPGWATPVGLHATTREPSAQYAFSSNFNAPLPEDAETICDPPILCEDDEHDVRALRDALSEPGKRIRFEDFRKELGI